MFSLGAPVRIRSDEGLALETLAFQSLLGGKFCELTLKKWEVPAGRISRNASRQDIIKRNNFCGAEHHLKICTLKERVYFIPVDFTVIVRNQ